MKTLKSISLLILAALFLSCEDNYTVICQTTAPNFIATDIQGNEHNLYEDYLDQGITVILQFHSPSLTCWPSFESTIQMNYAYLNYEYCNNKIKFIHIAEWGNDYLLEQYLDEYGIDILMPVSPPDDGLYSYDIPAISGTGGGSDITQEYNVTWAYEVWLIRPDKSFIADIAPAWEENVITDVIELEGFTSCSDSVLPDYTLDLNENTNTNPVDNNIYDLNGKLLNSIPSQGVYIKNGKKYFKTK